MLLLRLRRHGTLLSTLLLTIPIVTHSLSAAAGTEIAPLPSGVPRHPLLALNSPWMATDRRADESATEQAFKLSLGLHIKNRSEIVLNGLFADGPVLSESAIAALLFSNGLSFVEAAPANVRWVFGIAKNPGAEALKARSKKYVRLRRETSGHKDCLRWNNAKPQSAVWGHPKVVGSCLVLEYSDELRSDYRISIDLTNSAKRMAFYELSALRTEQAISRFPFWGQVDGRGFLLIPDDYTMTSIDKEKYVLQKRLPSIIHHWSALHSLLLRMRGPYFSPSQYEESWKNWSELDRKI
jgi:hypothetical protein